MQPFGKCVTQWPDKHLARRNWTLPHFLFAHSCTSFFGTIKINCTIFICCAENFNGVMSFFHYKVNRKRAPECRPCWLPLLFNCPALRNHFKVKASKQIFFLKVFIFMLLRASQNLVEEAWTPPLFNCPALRNHFKVKACKQIFFS